MAFIVVKKGQKIEVTDDYHTIEGTALRDYDAEGEKPLLILDDSSVFKVRVDLASSLIVDGAEMIHLL